MDLTPKRKPHKSLAEVDPLVFEECMKHYATELSYNACSIAEYLDISDRSFFNLVKKEPFKGYYEAAQARRAEEATIAGYTALVDTYKATVDGTAGDGQVAAAKNLANYLARYSENLILGPGNVRGDRAPKVNISIKLPEFNQVVGAVEIREEDEASEYDEN